MLGLAPAQVEVAVRCRELPIDVFSFSLRPMSTDVKPIAGPMVAVNDPSYDKNSLTLPEESTNAMPPRLFRMQLPLVPQEVLGLLG